NIFLKIFIVHLIKFFKKIFFEILNIFFLVEMSSIFNTFVRMASKLSFIFLVQTSLDLVENCYWEVSGIVNYKFEH
ncbi:hypothetical protein DD595_25545, partial [Enterobacter cloacae complex sp. 4DZ3-17B2]